MVTTDGEIALEDAFGEGAGILLISGTGSVAYGRGPTGTLLRAGGWGPTCGDEGSSTGIGRRALSVLTASHDGREPETRLVGAVLTALQLDEVDDLMRGPRPRRRRATWPPSRSRWSRSPPSVTCARTRSARSRPRSSCSTCARWRVELFVDERAAVPVALAGGMLRRGSFLRRLVEHHLKTAVPGSHLHGEEVVAARGAVKLARRALVNA